MPHVVLKGSTTVEDLWLAFGPLSFQEGGTVFKAQECFLSNDKRTLLVRSMVAEREFSRNFLLKIVQAVDGTMTMSLDKLAQTDRADSVKRYIGLCAWHIMQAAPDVTLERSNIAEFVRAPNAAP